jgi:hypothetical protein
MNTDKVLALAREDGGRPIYDGINVIPGVQTLDDASLTRFAALLQQQMEAENAEQCEWRISDEFEGDTWDGKCGAKWTFTEGGPVENDMHYCPNCGKTLAVIKERK